VKLKAFLLLVWMGTAALQAESQAGYAFLNKITELEHDLLAFTKYHLLFQAFPDKPHYYSERERYFERYESAIRQAAIDLRGGVNQTLLTRFVDAGNGMKELRAEAAPSSRSRLLQAGWILEEDIHRISSAKILTLTSTQRIVYVLTRMQMLLEGMTQDYVLALVSPKEKKARMDLRKRMKRFDENLQRCADYAYWRPEERRQRDRIAQTWVVWKRELGGRGLPLVLEVGSEHLSMLIGRLKQMHQGENEDE